MTGAPISQPNHDNSFFSKLPCAPLLAGAHQTVAVDRRVLVGASTLAGIEAASLSI